MPQAAEEEAPLSVSKRVLALDAEASCDNSPEHAKNSRSKVRRVSGEYQQVCVFTLDLLILFVCGYCLWSLHVSSSYCLLQQVYLLCSNT